MRFYEWAHSSEANCTVQDFQVQGWKEWRMLVEELAKKYPEQPADWRDIMARGRLEERLREARPFDEGEWDPRADVYWDENTPLTDLPFTIPETHLHSPRLKALMEELGLAQDIQYLPIKIKGTLSGKEVSEYYVANYLRRISCLDLEHSIYGRFGDDWIRHEQRGDLQYVWKAVLRLEAIGDCRIFRVDERKYIVAVREDVIKAIDEAGITGWRAERLSLV